MAALLWFVGLLWFVEQIPRSLGHSRYSDADAIVVLTGGGGRLESGIFLLANGIAGKLFVSGVSKGTSLKTLLSGSGIPKEMKEKALARQNDIVLGFMAFSTWSNAWEVARWAEESRYKKLYLVTANYHMPRALLEFQLTMPGAAFYPYPVFPQDFKPEQWWRHYPSLRLVISEYDKYLWARAQIYFE